MNKKELKKQYLQTQRPIGVYQIKNLVNGKMNRVRFQLDHGSHPNLNLQNEFKEFGSEKFVFEIIDYLGPKDETKTDYAEDLKMLEEMWIDKLQPFGENGYNKLKIRK